MTNQGFHKQTKAQDEEQDSFNVLMQYLSNEEYDAAESYMDAMVKKCKSVSRKALHHSLIHACAKRNNPSAALWCALRMMRTGLQPNTVTFNTLLHASAKTGDVKMATYLWDLMFNLGLTPNDITYNTMMNTFVKADNMDRAEWWLERMQSEGISLCPVSFDTIIAALAKAGDYQRAETWFARMRKAGVEPDKVVYSSMMVARAKAGHAREAEGWLGEMSRRGLQPDGRAYSTVICALAREGVLPRAEFWLRHMEKQGLTPDKSMLDALADSWARNGNLARSQYWMKVMMYGYSPSCLTWESFASVHTQAQQQRGEIGACWTSRASSRFGSETDPSLASAPGTPPPEVWQPPCEGGAFRTSRAGSYAASDGGSEGTSSNSSSDTFFCSLAGKKVLLRGAPGLERMAQPPHGASMSPGLLDLVNSQGGAAQSTEADQGACKAVLEDRSLFNDSKLYPQRDFPRALLHEVQVYSPPPSPYNAYVFDRLSL